MRRQRIESGGGARRALAPALALLLASCAAPIYLHSPSLEKATASAADAMPDAATALKPFDDQAANLSAFAVREDQAVARYWIAARDADFARILAQRDPAVQRQLLTGSITRRLKTLGGDAIAAGQRPWLELAAVSRTARRSSDSRARAEIYVESFTRQYRELETAKEPLDLKCETVLTEVPESERDQPDAARDDLERALRNLAGRCADRAAAIAEAASLMNELKQARGALGAEIENVENAEAVTADTLTAGDPDLVRALEHAKALATEIQSAEKFQSELATSIGLKQFRNSLADLWSNASMATKLAGLDGLDKSIDEWLRLGLCGMPGIAADVRKDARCDEEVTGTLGLGSKAYWSTAVALAALSDANAEQARSVQWLAAAKAIVAAERASVSLRVDQAKAEAAARRQRVSVMMAELSFLAQANHFLTSASPACSGGAPVGVSGSNFNCGFAAYVDAWNEGRIGGEVLSYRPWQLERTFIVRRARATAEKQHALAQAGTATLKTYGAGGLKPEQIGQLLFDLTVVGILGGKEL